MLRLASRVFVAVHRASSTCCTYSPVTLSLSRGTAGAVDLLKIGTLFADKDVARQMVQHISFGIMGARHGVSPQQIEANTEWAVSYATAKIGTALGALRCDS